MDRTGERIGPLALPVGEIIVIIGLRLGAVHDRPRPAETRLGAIRNLRREIAVRSEEHTSELQSLMRISYAVFCLKKKKNSTQQHGSQTPAHILQCNTKTHHLNTYA